MATLKIKLVKSLNGRLAKHIATANSPGSLQDRQRDDPA